MSVFTCRCFPNLLFQPKYSFHLVVLSTHKMVSFTNSNEQRRQVRSDSSADTTRTLQTRQRSHSETSTYDGVNDATEKGKHSSPLKPVGFWDKRLGKSRLEIFGLWTMTSMRASCLVTFKFAYQIADLLALILAIFILGVLSLYWACLFRVEQNLKFLRIYVVDFDGQVEPYTEISPLLGPLITRTTEKVSRSPVPHLGYITLPPSHFNNDPAIVRQRVYDQKAWAAIIVNANATALLQQAIQQGNTSYDPLGACQVVWVEARDHDTYSSYILPRLNNLQTEITSSFGSMWVEMVLKDSNIAAENLQRAPQALNPAIGFSKYSLRPFAPAVVIPAVSVGLIYLIIISFFSFAFFLPIHLRFITPDGHPPLKFWQYIIWRWVATVSAYCLLSLAYSLVSLAFQTPFSNHTAPDTDVANNPNAYGKGTFLIYWMINFVGMIALGLACENVAMTVGQPWVALWLIFWVISNVSTSFYPIELAPRFYCWGYAWPLHNGASITHLTVLFLGLLSRLLTFANLSS